MGSWLKVADTIQFNSYIFNVGHWWKTGKLNVWLVDVQDGGTRVIKKIVVSSGPILRQISSA